MVSNALLVNEGLTASLPALLYEEIRSKAATRILLLGAGAILQGLRLLGLQLCSHCIPFFFIHPFKMLKNE